MAMAHAVEGRYPFLDHRVSEFAARLHPSLKMRVLNEKFLLKEAARDLVPGSIRQRSKQPYRAPDGESFFCGRPPEYVDEMLSSSVVKATGIFDPDSVCKLVAKFQSGRTTSTKDNMALVGVLSTQLMIHQFIGSGSMTEPELSGAVVSHAS